MNKRDIERSIRNAVAQALMTCRVCDCPSSKCGCTDGDRANFYERLVESLEAEVDELRVTCSTEVEQLRKEVAHHEYARAEDIKRMSAELQRSQPPAPKHRFGGSGPVIGGEAHALLHRLWSNAVGTSTYVKDDWKRLETLLSGVP